MKLSKVQRILTKRLAWLTAKADESPLNGAIADERDALSTILRCQSMLDPRAGRASRDEVRGAGAPRRAADEGARAAVTSWASSSWAWSTISTRWRGWHDNFGKGRNDEPREEERRR